MRVFGVLAVAAGLLGSGSLSAQWSPAGTSMGAHFAFSVGGDLGGPIQERFGVQFLVPVVGPLVFGANLARLIEFPDVASEAVTGSGWLAKFTGRIRPLGPNTFLSLGAGMTVGRFHRRDPNQPSLTWWHTARTIMIGVEAPFARLRPFTEIYLMDGGGFGLATLLGLNVQVF